MRRSRGASSSGSRVFLRREADYTWSVKRMLAACVSMALITCGGGGGGPTPTPNPNPTNPNTFTITSAGVSPKELTVERGSRVRFVNNDSRRHDMGSDPHPDHSDCPEFATVGVLTPGQSL